MERTEVLDDDSSLKLYGMRSAYDETLATAIKRKHEPQRFVGDLLNAEISEKQARSIKYQLTVAKLAAGQGCRRLHLQEHADQRGSRARSGRRRIHRPAAQRRPRRGTGHRQDASGHRHRAKLHPSRIARSLLHHRRSVNQLEAEGRAGRQVRLADYLTRLDFVILDELGYLPSRRPAGSCSPPDQPSLRARLNHRHDQPRLRRMAERVRRSKN